MVLRYHERIGQQNRVDALPGLAAAGRGRATAAKALPCQKERGSGLREMKLMLPRNTLLGLTVTKVIMLWGASPLLCCSLYRGFRAIIVAERVPRESNVSTI